MKHNRKKNEYSSVGLVFFITGIALFVASTLVYFISSEVYKSYNVSSAVITYMDSNKTCVSFTANGQEINAVLNEYNSEYKTGDTIEVKYNPNNPEKATTGLATDILVLVFSLLGAIFAFLGAIFLLIGRLKKRKKQRLLNNGTPLTAVITEINTNYAIRMNRRSPICISCSYIAPDGINHIFSSSDIWDEIPSSAIGEKVTVYTAENNFNDFHIDTEALLSRCSPTRYHRSSN